MRSPQEICRRTSTPYTDNHSGNNAHHADNVEDAVKAVCRERQRNKRLSGGYGQPSRGIMKTGGRVAHPGGVGFRSVRKNHKIHPKEKAGNQQPHAHDTPEGSQIA